MIRPIPFLGLAAAILLGPAAPAPLSAQHHEDDYDDVDPWLGFESRASPADSATIARFLKSLAAADPVVCQIAVSSIGNHWGRGDSDERIGLLSDEAAESAARDALRQDIPVRPRPPVLPGPLGIKIPAWGGTPPALLGN